MSQDKSITLYGLAGELEAAYGDGGAVSLVTDGIQLAEPFQADVAYLDDGARAAPPGSAIAHQQNTAPTGKHFTGTAFVEGRGLGSAYAADAFPPDISVFQEISGHSATVDVTGGAETWTYVPHALTTSPESGGFSAYSRGELHPLDGVYGSLGFIADAGKPGRFSCAMRGRMTTNATDVALPAITYSQILHPKAEGMGIEIGLWTAATLRRVEFTQNRNLADRLDLSGAAAYAGAANDRMAPTLVTVVEMEGLEAGTPWNAAGAIDPYKMYENGIEVALTFTVGTVKYNKYTFTGAQAQLSAPPEFGEDGPTGLWTLTWQLNPSTAILQDAYTWLFD